MLENKVPFFEREGYSVPLSLKKRYFIFQNCPKWTTYRKMGEDGVNLAALLAQLPPEPTVTAHLPLHGWTQAPFPDPLNVYGSDAPLVQALPGADVLLHPRLPYTEAEVRWAVRYELARTVEDVLARRTRSLLLDAIASLEAAPRVAAILAEEVGQNETWQQQLDAYTGLVRKLNQGLASPGDGLNHEC